MYGLKAVPFRAANPKGPDVEIELDVEANASTPAK